MILELEVKVRRISVETVYIKMDVEDADQAIEKVEEVLSDYPEPHAGTSVLRCLTEDKMTEDIEILELKEV